MAEENEAPSLFELLGPPISTDPGSVYDYDVSSGEMLGAGFGRQLDTNAMISGVIRPLNYLNEDLMNIAGATEWVGAETARKEITGAGLELKVPDNGISRYELDTIKYLKKRELEQNQIMARNQTLMGTAAGFAGGLAAGLTDPLNIASAFIPIVPQARYAAWVAEASGAIGRAGVRAGVGVAEGVAGAALLEPLAYSGAQASQLEYTAADSFINIVFGGVMGGGLHSAGGVAFDFFNAGQIAAAKEVGNWLPYLSSREAAANAPDDVKMGALHNSVRALEDDLPVRADEAFEAWHGSPHTFDEFKIEAIGTGEGAQAWGNGFYFAEAAEVAQSYRRAGPSADAYYKGINDRLKELSKEMDAISIPGQYRKFKDQERGAALAEEYDRLMGERSGFGNVYKVKIRGAADEYPVYTGKMGQEAKDFADAVRESGARGIRFLDQVSRDTGEGTYNYVVFNPDDITVVSRNGEPVAKPKAPKKDAFAAEDMETSALADRAATMGDDLESVASDVEFLDAQINGMKSRDMWTKGDEAAMEAGEAVAKKLEDTASIYRAAAVCMAE